MPFMPFLAKLRSRWLICVRKVTAAVLFALNRCCTLDDIVTRDKLDEKKNQEPRCDLMIGQTPKRVSFANSFQSLTANTLMQGLKLILVKGHMSRFVYAFRMEALNVGKMQKDAKPPVCCE